MSTTPKSQRKTAVKAMQLSKIIENTQNNDDNRDDDFIIHQNDPNLKSIDSDNSTDSLKDADQDSTSSDMDKYSKSLVNKYNKKSTDIQIQKKLIQDIRDIVQIFKKSHINKSISVGIKRNTLNNIETLLEKLLNMVIDNHSKVQQLKNQYDPQDKNHSLMISSTSPLIKKITKKQSQLTEENKILQKENEELQNQLILLKEENITLAKNLQENKDETNKVIWQLKEQNETLSEEIKQKEKDISCAKITLQEITEEIMNLKNDNKELKKSLNMNTEAYESQIKKLKLDCQNFREDCERLRGKFYNAPENSAAEELTTTSHVQLHLELSPPVPVPQGSIATYVRSTGTSQDTNNNTASLPPKRKVEINDSPTFLAVVQNDIELLKSLDKNRQKEIHSLKRELLDTLALLEDKIFCKLNEVNEGRKLQIQRVQSSEVTAFPLDSNQQDTSQHSSIPTSSKNPNVPKPKPAHNFLHTAAKREIQRLVKAKLTTLIIKGKQNILTGNEIDKILCDFETTGYFTRVEHREDCLRVFCASEKDALIFKDDFLKSHFSTQLILEVLAEDYSECIIYSLPKFLEEQEIINTLSTKFGLVPSDIKILRYFDTKNASSQNCIFAIPNSFTPILTNDNTLKFRDEVYLMQRFIKINRCTNCQSLVHVKSKCHNPTYCARCGGEHNGTLTNCQKDFYCINCSDYNHKYGTQFDTKHPTYSKNCATYKAELNYKLNKIKSNQQKSNSNFEKNKRSNKPLTKNTKPKINLNSYPPKESSNNKKTSHVATSTSVRRKTQDISESTQKTLNSSNSTNARSKTQDFSESTQKTSNSSNSTQDSQQEKTGPTSHQQIRNSPLQQQIRTPEAVNPNTLSLNQLPLLHSIYNNGLLQDFSALNQRLLSSYALQSLPLTFQDFNRSFLFPGTLPRLPFPQSV